MVRDFSYLNPVGVEPNEGLLPLDQRWHALVQLIDDGRVEDAARGADSLLREGVLDVRLVPYPLLQFFRDEGLSTLAVLTQNLLQWLSQGVTIYGPQERKDRYLGVALVRVFEDLESMIHYRSVKKDDVWTAWLEADVDLVAVLKNAEQNLDSLASLLNPERLATPLDRIARLRSRLIKLHEQVAARTQEPELPTRAKTTPESPVNGTGKVLPGDPLVLKASAPLATLCNKLRAFARLVEEHEYRRAAVVADDVAREVESFDPRRYLPELFAEFGALLSENVAHIAPHWEHKDSVEWRTLEQFYSVDLDGFTRKRRTP